MATTVSVTVPPTNTIALPSSTSLPTFTGPPSPSQNPGNGVGSQGVNYFFGFLIAFIGLLLFFVGCGFGARRSIIRNRRLQQRMNDAGLAFDDAGVDGVLLRNREGFKEPILWERPFQQGTGQWELMMPLSATVVPEGVVSSGPTRPSSTPSWRLPQTTSEARLRRRQSLSSFFFMPFSFFIFPSPRLRRARTAGGDLSLGSVSQTSSRHSLPTSIRAHQPTPSADVSSPIPPTADGSSTALPEKKLVPETPPMNLQIVVIIAMPSQHHTDDTKQVLDIQLGTKRVPVPGNGVEG